MSLERSDRPWGSYEVLLEISTHKIKTITVKPGARLSLQRHQKRAEHWFIVLGKALVTVGNKKIKMAANSAVDIAIGELHRIENIGSTDLVFIEVQTGTYFGEDDIERIEDDFGRA